MRSLILLLTLTTTLSLAQEIPELQLIPGKDPQINHRFELHISKDDLNKVLYSSGSKVQIRKPVLLYNGDTLKVKSIKTRGRSSLKFRRKSLSVSLLSPLDIDGTKVSKFALLGLVMDKNYWRNRWSFLMLNNIDLFPLENTYSEVIINEQTLGTYLFVQKADDYTKQLNSPVLLRREYMDKYEIETADGELGKKLKKTIQKGRNLTKEFTGELLERELSKILDLQQYYDWLGFNFLVMNGDYSDEVYFYYDQDFKIYRIIPWDYDDVFSTQPHEGWAKRRLNIEHDLLFSGESYLDRVIDKDEYLYNQYLQSLEKLIKKLQTDNLSQFFEQVYQELYPFFTDPDIIAQSAHDQSGLTELSKLEDDLNQYFQFLSKRINSTQNLINEFRINSSQ